MSSNKKNIHIFMAQSHIHHYRHTSIIRYRGIFCIFDISHSFYNADFLYFLYLKKKLEKYRNFQDIGYYMKHTDRNTVLKLRSTISLDQNSLDHNDIRATLPKIWSGGFQIRANHIRPRLPRSWKSHEILKISRKVMEFRLKLIKNLCLSSHHDVPYLVAILS